MCYITDIKKKKVKSHKGDFALKKLLVILSVFIAVCVGVFFIILKGLDVDNYRKQVLTSIEELTGRKVQIKGAIDLKWRPSPTITITNLLIANIKDSKQPVMVQVKKVNAVVEWNSLFKNPLVFKSIILEEPTIYLERLENKQVNWNFDFLKGKPLLNDSFVGTKKAFNSPKFENTKIVNGRVLYEDIFHKNSYDLEKINGTLVADSVQGPFKFDGTFGFEGKDMKLLFGTDKIASDRATEINLLLSSEKDNLVLRFKGFVSELSVGTALSGSTSLKIKHFSDFMKDYLKRKEIPSVLNSSLIGNMNIDLTDKDFLLSDIAFRYGNQENINAFTGKLSYSFEKKEKDTLKHWKGNFLFDKVDSNAFITWAKEAFKTSSLSFLKSEGQAIDLSFKVSELMYNKQSVMNTDLSFLIDETGTKITHFSTSAPFNSKLTATGQIAFENDLPVLKSKVDFVSDDLKSLLLWGSDIKEFPFKASLKQTTFKGDVLIKKDTFDFKDFSADIDDAKFEGDLNLNGTSLLGTLKAKNWDIDDFIPPSDKKAFHLQDIPSLFAKKLQSFPLFNAYSTKMSLSLKDVTLQEIPVAQIETEFETTPHLLEIKNFKATDAATLSLQAKGSLLFDKETNLPSFKNFSLEGTLLDAKIFKSRIPLIVPIQDEKTLNKSSFKATLSGTPSTYTLDAITFVSQGKIAYKGTVFQKEGHPSYKGNLEIEHPNFHSFVELFNPSFKEFENLTGSLKFSSDITTQESLYSFENLKGQIGNQVLTGSLTYLPIEKKLTGSVEAAAFDLDKFIDLPPLFSNSKTLLFSKEPLLFEKIPYLFDLKVKTQLLISKDNRIQNVSFAFKKDKDALVLDDFTGAALKGQIKLEATYIFSKKEFKGTVSLDTLKLTTPSIKFKNLSVEKTDLTLNTTFEGVGTSPFEIMQTLKGYGKLSLIRPQIQGFSLEKIEKQIRNISLNPQDADEKNFEKDLHLNLSLGTTAFNSLKGDFSINKGVLSLKKMDFFTRQAHGKIRGNYTFKTQSPNLKAFVTMEYLKKLPEFTLLFSGSFEKPLYTQDTQAFQENINTLIKTAQKTLEKKKVASVKKPTEDKNKERKTKIREMRNQAEDLLKSTKILIDNAPKSDASLAYEDLQDMCNLIKDIDIKEYISMLDYRKVEEFYQRAKDKALEAKTLTVQKSLELGRKAIDKIATEKTPLIKRIDLVNKALSNVDEIKEAFDEAFQASLLLDKNKLQAESETDVKEMERLLKSSKQAFELIQNRAKKLERYDISSYLEKMNKKEKVQGTIDAF